MACYIDKEEYHGISPIRDRHGVSVWRVTTDEGALLSWKIFKIATIAKTVRGYKNMSLNKIFDTTTIVLAPSP